MPRRLQRSAFAPLLGLALALGLSQGCFSKLDPDKIPCDMSRKTSCPTGYVCTLVDGLGPMCRRPTDGGFDAPTIVTEAGAPDLAGEAQPTRVDGLLSEAGSGEAGGGSRLEAGVDFGTGSPSDVPIGVSETGGGDRPAGTGGSSGGDAITFPGLDLGTDVPQIVPTDAATGGAGGAGGMIGTGGGGGGIGTGGAGGAAGATGTGGGGGTGGGTGTGGSRTNGSPCTGTQDCDSGNCADNVCCDKPCGACSACTLALTSKPDGTCAPVLGGVDPHSACTDETATNQCGNDGFCDGKGTCRKVGTSHVCTAGVCNSTLFTPASTCDGLGACLPVSATDCGLSACSPTDGCQTTCSSDGQCVGQSYCDTTASTCKAKKTDGLDCTSGKECVSAFCIDGVCCHTDCGGCNACALALTGQASGTCAPATVDTDPHNTCSPDSPPCGHDGNCDGAGDCKFASATTGCGAEACTGTLYTPAAHCTGSGTCNSVSSSTCPNNLACGATQCKTTCSTNTDCAAGFTCPSAGSTSCSVPCGNGTVDAGEGCDDGNTITTDGCSACQVSPGWACEGAPSVCQQVIYVNAAATGANDGSTWANAYTSLTTGLGLATAGKSIWIAQGTYKPTTTTDRTRTFTLKDGVPVYGGFLGVQGETLAARDWRTHPTIITGDLSGNDGNDFLSNDENSYHVLTANGGTVALDGLHVRGGNANGTGSGQGEGGGLRAFGTFGAVSIRNCIFESNSASVGGAAAFLPKSAVQLVDSTFRGNRGQTVVDMGLLGRIDGCLFENNTHLIHYEGITVSCVDSDFTTVASLLVLRSVFRSNVARTGVLYVKSYGGGTCSIVSSMFEGNHGSATYSLGGPVSARGRGVDYPLTVRMTNTVLLSNEASHTVGYFVYSKAYLRNVTAAFGSSTSYPVGAEYGTDDVYAYNSILWDTSAVGATGSLEETAHCATRYSVNGGVGNTRADPLLEANGVPAIDSPVANAGNNSYVPADSADVDGDGNTSEILPLDLAGNARIQGAAVDMGAYEVK